MDRISLALVSFPAWRDLNLLEIHNGETIVRPFIRLNEIEDKNKQKNLQESRKCRKAEWSFVSKRRGNEKRSAEE